jgi:hypothetical protein
MLPRICHHNVELTEAKQQRPVANQPAHAQNAKAGLDMHKDYTTESRLINLKFFLFVIIILLAAFQNLWL